MGDDAYLKLIAAVTVDDEIDLDADPEIEKFFNGVNSYEVNGELRYYGGFKEAILAFAWFRIMRDFHQFSSEQGILTGMSETSGKSATANDVLVSMYNIGVDRFEKARQYIYDYMMHVLHMDSAGDAFELFRHTPITKISWL
jgi:hypothetical protein